MDIAQIASVVNWTFNTNNQRNCFDAMTNLYQSVQRDGGGILLNLPSSNCQSVGLAFTCMALSFDNGDKDINSVAAENAYYCLAKSYLRGNNSFTLPAVFTLLQKTPYLLFDKFIGNWCAMSEKEIGMPIGMMLGGNPFRDPKLQDFRNQAIGFMEQVKYYTLNIFYDIDSMVFRIPTDMPYFLPTQQEVKAFLSVIRQEKSFDHSEYLSIGEEHFEGVYKQCEDTLHKI